LPVADGLSPFAFRCRQLSARGRNSVGVSSGERD